MYKYLYIFEDGSVKQTNETPSKDDCTSISDGILEIIYVEDSIFHHFDPEVKIVVEVIPDE